MFAALIHLTSPWQLNVQTRRKSNADRRVGLLIFVRQNIAVVFLIYLQDLLAMQL